MIEYKCTDHNITNAAKLQQELISAGEAEPQFAINADVYIYSDVLTQKQVDAIIIAAGD